MKRKIFAALASVILLLGLLSSESIAEDRYVHRLVSKEAAARSAVAAGFDQAVGTPSEWGGGIKGFGRRLGSAFGTHIIRSTIHYGVSKMLHEELDYKRSDKQGFRQRLSYALLATVITRKTTTGRETVAVGSISGIVGSAMISRLWHPVRFHTVASGFSAAGVGFGAEAGINVLREFWPDIRHPHRRVQANPAPGPGTIPESQTSN